MEITTKQIKMIAEGLGHEVLRIEGDEVVYRENPPSEIVIFTDIFNPLSPDNVLAMLKSAKIQVWPTQENEWIAIARSGDPTKQDTPEEAIIQAYLTTLEEGEG